MSWSDDSRDHQIAGTADRSRWPVCRFRLGEEPGDDLSKETTRLERLEMMWALALEAYALAGREIPDYARHETPCRVLRGYDPRRVDDDAGATEQRLIRNKTATGRMKDLADVERLRRLPDATDG